MNQEGGYPMRYIVLVIGILWSTIVYSSSVKEKFIDRVEGCIQAIDHRDIPIKLIIGTAALESGWGTSRFAKEGNNLFGIRTFKSHVPQLKPLKNPNANFGVKVYNDVCESVKDYIDVIETHHNYVKFRVLKSQGVSLDVLVHNLGGYAENSRYTILLTKVIGSL